MSIAARIESANRYFGTRVLISEHTLTRLNSSFRLREIDRIRVRGHREPFSVFDVLDYHQPGRRLDTLLANFDQGLRHYRQRDWQTARSSFSQALEAMPGDRPSRLYIDRCSSFMDQPPGDAWQALTDFETGSQ